MNQPLITIITVSYNAIDFIETTIQSVINQTYSNIEYIIIDGKSTDGTVEVIKKYTDHISYWVSESDRGIYDAMNKGIELAHGEWVNFMNCGDVFFQNTIVDIIATFVSKSECDIVYGDVMLNINGNLKLKKARSLEYIEYSLPFCHQSSFVKLALLRKNRFDLSYKIAADYALFYKLYSEIKCSFIYVGEVVAIYEATLGISSASRKKAYREICSINKRSQGFFGKIRLYIICFLLFIKVLK